MKRKCRINNPVRILACKIQTTIVIYEHNIAIDCNCNLFLLFLSISIFIIGLIYLWQPILFDIISQLVTIITLHIPP
ncbi:hypothetical protein EUGRSUZ_B01488 [Eucalyptus grandis]|uniref:Uncharacterized protein n=2 Tax=Eucalyptus grandis TaxID=71139 RepID=A0A059D2K4_EUCGR|nr:hypothetical protein EUGRSUZ_B01488 [Eucalyptus grandis]